jgi:hypothetical protein
MAGKSESRTIWSRVISPASPRLLPLLILGLLIVGFCILIFSLSVNRPYIGTQVEHKDGSWVVTFVDFGGLAADNGIKPGDSVIEVDGQPAAELTGKVLRPTSELKVVSQGGEEKLITVSGSTPSTDALVEPISFLILSILLWSIGFLVFTKRPESKQALLLYLLTLAIGAALIAVPGDMRDILGMRELQVVMLTLISAMYLHLFLIFPKERQVTWHGRNVMPLVYLPAIILLILFAAFGYREEIVLTWFRYAILAYLGLGLFLGTAVLIHSYLIADSYRYKQQTKIVMAGSLMAVLPFLFLACIPEIAGGSTLVPVEFSVLGIIFVPLSIGYAVLRYRLMDIDLMVRRGVIYGILLLVLAIGYVLFAFLLDELLGPLSETTRIIIIVAYSLVVILFFAPLKERLQRVVDRYLFRDRYDYKQAIRSVGASLASFTDINLSARFLTESIPRILGLSGAYLVLQGASGQPTVMAKSGKFALETDGSLLALAKELKEVDLFPNLAGNQSGVAYFIPLKIRDRQVGLLCVGEKRVPVNFTHDDISFLFTLSDQIGVTIESTMLATEVKEQAKKLEDSYQELQQYASSLEAATRRLEEAYLGMIRTLVLTLEARDSYTRGHSERVSQLVRQIGLELRLSPEEIQEIELAAKLHDISKIGIPDDILQKPGPLDTREKAEMELHPTRAVEILRFLDFLEPVLPIIEAHHEWYDGTGYPNGIKGEEIPLGARILAVADAYDAMASARRYRPPFDTAEIIEQFKQGAGVQWDPDVVKAMLRLLSAE